MGSFSTVNGAMVHARVCVHACVCAMYRGGAAEEGSSCFI